MRTGANPTVMTFTSFQFPHDVHRLPFEDVPLGRDVFLIGSREIEELKAQWERFLGELPRGGAKHPNESLHYRLCALKTRGIESCEMSLAVSMYWRWHSVVRTLPRQAFNECVDFWGYSNGVYLIVDQDWFQEIDRLRLDLYALLDAIGMRDLLARQGKIESNQLTTLKRELDLLSESKPEYAFLTFADNVLIKRKCTTHTPEYDSEYQPERFLRVVSDVRSCLHNALGLDSYAIVSQGIDQFTDDSSYSVSPSGNHIFFGCLGIPFVELFDIDTSARKAIRAHLHKPQSLYLGRSLFLSLMFKDSSVRDRLQGELHPYESKVSSRDESAYLPIDEREILSLLKESGPAPS